MARIHVSLAVLLFLVLLFGCGQPPHADIDFEEVVVVEPAITTGTTRPGGIPLPCASGSRNGDGC